MAISRRNVEDYIYRIPNLLNGNECKQAVKEFQTINFVEHKFYDPRKKLFHTRSGANELAMSWDDIPFRKLIMDRIYTGIQSYIDYYDMPWFSSWQGYSDVRFNEYKENKKMALHCDHIRSMFDGEKKGVPILSCLGALNDDYEGGEFIMFDDLKIDIQVGEMIIFPSNFMYPHKVEPVTKGNRYTYISWVY